MCIGHDAPCEGRPLINTLLLWHQRAPFVSLGPLDPYWPTSSSNWLSSCCQGNSISSFIEAQSGALSRHAREIALRPLRWPHRLQLFDTIHIRPRRETPEHRRRRHRCHRCAQSPRSCLPPPPLASGFPAMFWPAAEVAVSQCVTLAQRGGHLRPGTVHQKTVLLEDLQPVGHCAAAVPWQPGAPLQWLPVPRGACPPTPCLYRSKQGRWGIEPRSHTLTSMNAGTRACRSCLLSRSTPPAGLPNIKQLGQRFCHSVPLSRLPLPQRMC